VKHNDPALRETAERNEVSRKDFLETGAKWAVGTMSYLVVSVFCGRHEPSAEGAAPPTKSPYEGCSSCVGCTIPCTACTTGCTHCTAGCTTCTLGNTNCSAACTASTAGCTGCTVACTGCTAGCTTCTGYTYGYNTGSSSYSAKAPAGKSYSKPTTGCVTMTGRR